MFEFLTRMIENDFSYNPIRSKRNWLITRNYFYMESRDSIFILGIKPIRSLILYLNAYLVIVGDGIERPYLEGLVKQLNLINRTRFVGTRRDVERFYAIGDVFVLPSKYEGFGQVFLEAMASELPCIGLRPDYPNIIVACDEIIRDGITGYLADPYSTDDLAVKIEKIISDDALRAKLGMESRKICEDEYSWEKSVGSLIALSQMVLKKR